MNRFDIALGKKPEKVEEKTVQIERPENQCRFWGPCQHRYTATLGAFYCKIFTSRTVSCPYGLVLSLIEGGEMNRFEIALGKEPEIVETVNCEINPTSTSFSCEYRFWGKGNKFHCKLNLMRFGKKEIKHGICDRQCEDMTGL